MPLMIALPSPLIPICSSKKATLNKRLGRTFQGMMAAVAVAAGLLPDAHAQGEVPEIMYYRFDGTGTTVPNLASSPPAGTTTATIMGGLTQGGTGQFGGGLIGTGSSSNNDYLNTGWAPNLSG